MRFLTTPKSIGLLVPTALIFVTVIGGIGVADKNKPSAVAKKSSAKKSKPKTPRNTIFSDFRRWKCVNPEAFWVPWEIAVACAAPPPRNARSQVLSGPHSGKFIRVYINPIARDAMLQMKTPKFARGSVIVKEKLTTAQSKNAELLTVMVKREKGFDASNGDWEYMVLNGSGTKVQQRGKLSNCQSCHAPQKV